MFLKLFIVYLQSTNNINKPIYIKMNINSNNNNIINDNNDFLALFTRSPPTIPEGTNKRFLIKDFTIVST